jgi:hypothetical protein
MQVPIYIDTFNLLKEAQEIEHMRANRANIVTRGPKKIFFNIYDEVNQNFTIQQLLLF